MTSDVSMSSSSCVMTMAEVDILRAVFHSSRRYGAIVWFDIAFHASSMAMTLNPSISFDRILMSNALTMQSTHSE